VPADCRNLPGKSLLRLDAFEAGQEPVHEARDDIGSQRETRRMLAAVLAFDPGPLQEGSVGQDIR
jgi:hypothetical protein